MSGRVRAPPRAIAAVHDRQITRHGGAPGIRDAVLLEMDSSRAMNLAAHGEPSPEEVAAARAVGTAETHAFVDANERTVFVTAPAFLPPNGLALPLAPAEGVRMMEGLASDDAAVARLVQWLAKGTAPL